MKILLPPSEKKNEPKQKTALKLNALSFNADLTTTRTAVLKKHKEIDLSRLLPFRQLRSHANLKELHPSMVDF